ncbi:hypothetical protein OS493_017274 [Desmophyllum pertusum]|uniref:G-protein coupled receptors family 1 profile domain-containing protein n=1 Tax=Desmophyllum pertusum TaxID=174260 RepID=A0A9X0A159_9CNID|nr:hypothetical protein OS493_017274 [Desmophyllum pertusum]
MAENSIVDALITILSVLVVLANVTICLLVITNKSLRTYTNGFLVSLAISDILLGGVLFPVILTIPDSPASGYLISVILLSGVANHCCITFDRFIAVCYPFSYSYLIEKYFMKMLLTAWVVAVAFSLLPLCWDTDQTLTIHEVYIFVEIVGFIFLPYLLIIIAYCLIFKKLREHFKLLKETAVSITRREQARRLSSEAKVAKVCLILIATFALCWLPIIYMTSAMAVGRPEIVPLVLLTVSKFTLAMSSLINPLLYSFKKEDFRSAMKKVFTRNANGQVYPTVQRNQVLTVREGTQLDVP